MAESSSPILISLLLLVYFWLCWIFLATCGFSLVVLSGGCFSLQCMDFSLPRPLLSGAQTLGCMGSVVVARRLQNESSGVVTHGLSCSVACGIFPQAKDRTHVPYIGR